MPGFGVCVQAEAYVNSLNLKGIAQHSKRSVSRRRFGVNDGLVSNLSLAVMGVAGASDDARFVLLAGVAGLLAELFDGCGRICSMRAQRELFENEIEIERRELAEDPKGEEKELELIYRSKGLPNAAAAQLASEMMSDPDVALDTHAKEELGLNMKELGFAGAAASSFVAFVIGTRSGVALHTLVERHGFHHEFSLECVCAAGRRSDDFELHRSRLRD